MTFKKIRVNFVDGKWWFQPSIVTMSMYKWAYRPFVNFEDLLKYTDKATNAIWVNINGDPNFRAFNQIQKVHNSQIRLNPNLITQKKDYEAFLTDNILIKIPYKGLLKIQKGKQFSIPTLEFSKLATEFYSKLEQDQFYQFTFDGFDYKISIEKRKENLA
ncbi:hypothetical protein [Mycoplasma hafezii]|uniref:hypothetical protein n=1 Tax=Mycoplasma hafezii TaxID=525886 RepID=UPI003CFA3562